jgi:phosphoribosylformylglycinamidine cyclo-ligase
MKEIFNEILKQTISKSGWKFGFSEFCPQTGFFEMGGKLFAIRVDSAGSKTSIGCMLRKYETIGMECLALGVNHLISMGFTPTHIFYSLGIEKEDERIVTEVLKGLTKNAREANVSICGGEIFVEHETIKGFHFSVITLGNAYKDRIIKNDAIRADDIIIGLESSGLQNEGISIAKKVLLQRYDIGTHVKELDCYVGEELLKPTFLYAKPVLEIIENCKIHGMAFIDTIYKLKSIGEKAHVGFDIKLPKPIKPIFRLVQHHGILSDREMFKNFNMGIGFVIIVPGEDPEYYERVADILKKYGIKHHILGKVTRIQKFLIDGVEML